MPASTEPSPVDAATAAAYVARITSRPCAPGTIRSCASRNHIHRVGRRGRNTLYSLRELHIHFTGEDPYAPKPATGNTPGG